jgi:hypothetical protein
MQDQMDNQSGLGFIGLMGGAVEKEFMKRTKERDED